MEKLQYIFLTLLASASFQDVFVYCDGKYPLSETDNITYYKLAITYQYILVFLATDYLHACPNPDKPLGWTDAGKFVKEIWPKYFGSLDNQPWTLIANEQATVNCCDENGGCIREGNKIGKCFKTLLKYGYFVEGFRKFYFNNTEWTGSIFVVKISQNY